MTKFPVEVLRRFVEDLFCSCRIPRPDAGLAAEVLVEADRRGIDSHGVARLHSYIGLLEQGRINPTPTLTVVRETAATASVDGDNGLGLVIGPKANDLACRKADETGSGWVAVRNTNHYGIAGYYAMQAAARGHIGLSMTNTTPIVAPLWGGERMLGTNPIAIAFPADQEPAVVVDMATSTVAFGKIEIALRENREIPLGWAIDADGHPTTDPREVTEGGALLPLGSERNRGGHKGYCLATMVDMLSAVLSGANWGPFAPPFVAGQEAPARVVGKGIGHFFGALRIDGFADPPTFKREVDRWVRAFRNTRPSPGSDGTLVPGDPERLASQERDDSGVPVSDSILATLRDIGRRRGVRLG